MPKNYYASLRLVFLSIFAAPLMFLAVVIFTRNGENTPLVIGNDPFFFIVVIMGTGAIIASKFLYEKRLASIKAMSTPDEKLNAWRALFIMRVAIIEGVTLFTVIVFQMQHTDIYMFIALALSAFQITHYPKENKIKNDCEIV